MTTVSPALPSSVGSPPLAFVETKYSTFTGTVIPAPTPTFDAHAQYVTPTASHYAWLKTPSAVWVYIVAFCVFAGISTCIIDCMCSRRRRRKARESHKQSGLDVEKGFTKRKRDVNRLSDDMTLEELAAPEEARVRGGDAVERVRLMRVTLGRDREREVERALRGGNSDARDRDEEDERLYNMSRLPF